MADEEEHRGGRAGWSVEQWAAIVAVVISVVSLGLSGYGTWHDHERENTPVMSLLCVRTENTDADYDVPVVGDSYNRGSFEGRPRTTEPLHEEHSQMRCSISNLGELPLTHIVLTFHLAFSDSHGKPLSAPPQEAESVTILALAPKTSTNIEVSNNGTVDAVVTAKSSIIFHKPPSEAAERYSLDDTDLTGMELSPSPSAIKRAIQYRALPESPSHSEP